MTLFNEEENSTNTPELTPEISQDIYSIFKILKIKIEDISEVFKRQNELSKNYHFCYFEDISNEVLALMEKARLSMMRVEKTYEEIIWEDEDLNPIYETVIIPPAPSNEAELVLELASDILDVNILVKDYMNYILNYKPNTTRAEFEGQFIFLRTQNDFI